MSKLIKGFFDFVREQGIVGLAVAIAIGIQASDTVDTIVEHFINPFVGIILQGTNLSGIESEVAVGKSVQVFGWGAILQSIITLLATAFVVYFIVDKAGLTKLDKKNK